MYQGSGFKFSVQNDNYPPLLIHFSLQILKKGGILFKIELDYRVKHMKNALKTFGRIRRITNDQQRLELAHQSHNRKGRVLVQDEHFLWTEPIFDFIKYVDYQHKKGAEEGVPEFVRKQKPHK
jgi:hypothetical protein